MDGHGRREVHRGKTTGSAFRDFKGHFMQYFKKTVRRGKHVVKTSTYKSFVFSVQHPYEVRVSTSMGGLMHLMFPIMKPNVIPDFPTAPLYVTPLPVKAAK